MDHFTRTLGSRRTTAATLTKTLAEVRPPQPRGKAYRPLQLLYAQRDTGKAKEVKLLLEVA